MKTKNNFSGSAEYYDIILGKKKFLESSKFVERILKRNKIRSILEVGCGSGLYLFSLKKAGFDIEGLDISKEMLDIARKNKPKVRLYLKDMSNFKINKRYDAILCLNSSLILLPNFKLIEKTIRNISKHLSNGGLFLIDLPNHPVEIKKNNHIEIEEKSKIKGGSLKINSTEYKEKNKWITEWRGKVTKGKIVENFQENYEELIYSPKNLEKSLKDAGFTILKVFGSRKGGEFYEGKSWRRFYLCQKGRSSN